MENIGKLSFDFSYLYFFISLTQLFFAGAVGGVTNAIVVTPVERVKCLLQVTI
jgi:hypothetical protein